MTFIIFTLNALAIEISGQIKEVGTGLTINGAEISIGSSPIPVDENGHFTFDIDDTTTVVRITSPAHLQVEVAASKLVSRNGIVWLRPDISTPEIIVEDKKYGPHAMSQSLDREQVERTPGTHDDPIRLLQSLSSVAKTREYGPSAGDIILRTAQPSENRILLDGVEIPYLYHFQQYASVIHTRMLDTVTVFPSAYDVRYGDTAGGVVNVETKDAESRYTNGAANVNLIVAGGTITHPVGQGAVTVSGRRSHADLYDSDSEQYTKWPVFWDYLSRYEHKSSQGVKLSLSAIGARDVYGRLLNDTESINPVQQENNPDFTYDRMFHSLIAKADMSNDKIRSVTALGAVHDLWKAELPDASQKRRDNYISFRNQTDWLISDLFHLAGGIDGRSGKIKRSVSTDKPYATLSGEAPLLNQGLNISDNLDETTVGIWIQPKLTIDKLSLQPGSRLQFNPNQNDLAHDPRFILRYQTPIWSFRSGLGQYSQFPDPDAVMLNPELELTRSKHVSVGIDRLFTESIQVKMDAWGRQTSNSISTEFGTTPVINDTTAYGGEVALHYRVQERIFSWLSFTTANSRSNGEVWAYDQPYAVDAVLSWRFKPKWDFGFRYRYSAGLPYVQVGQSIYQADSNDYSPVLDENYSVRLPDYQKIDLHVAKRRWIGPVTMTTYFEIWYVPQQANYLYPIYNYNYLDSKLVVGPPLVPLVGVRFEN